MSRPLPALAAAVALALAGCGEKSEPEPAAPTGGGGPQSVRAATSKTTTTEDRGKAGGKPTPEQKVQRAVTAVLGGGDPAAACSDLVTAKYVRAAYGDEQGCRAGVSRQGTVRVAVSAVKVRGRAASAKAEPAAGPNRGETIRVELVSEAGTWKVDSAVSNAPPGP